MDDTDATRLVMNRRRDLAQGQQPAARIFVGGGLFRGDGWTTEADARGEAAGL